MDNFKSVISEIESPIEQLLCGSLLSESLLQCHGVLLQGNNDGIFLGNDGPDKIIICLQYHIDKYRVDFYIEYCDLYLKTTKGLIVECDGHEFHEKNKEQTAKDKKRDRTLQHKCPVFRFTGSEIYKAPYDCVAQIFNYLDERP